MDKNQAQKLAERRQKNLALFKYYHGEENCPYDNDTPQSKFWFVK